ncbi:MAG TPA: chemotaxis protein CheW [Candidatus Binatia bacterium]|jgi:chemotaxis-related protein WspD|nr:chemotaxis protein CheW [Candidatus Binatia bacterium]
MTELGVQVTSAPDAPPELSACWNEIGVYGKNSCAQLEQFSHCRNCPVYSAAGVQLLDRPLPAKYRHEWARHFAIEKPRQELGTSSAVLFRVHGEWLGLPTQCFQEVAERRQIHSLPHRRNGSVLGLANVRGELVICGSLGHLFGLAHLPSAALLRTTYNRLLVANHDGHRFGFPVEEVHGPHRFHPQDLQAAPMAVAKISANHLQGVLHWQERTVGFLDAELLFATLNQALT